VNSPVRFETKHITLARLVGIALIGAGVLLVRII
jgi:hypothetical protein